ncbi:MAG: glutathione peroxidase, partial [Vicingaceae bacterium]
MTSLYDIKINAIDGNPIDLNNYKGKYLLFVNVA